MQPKTITAQEFDELFDSGSDEIDAYLTPMRPIRPSVEQDVDFDLDVEASIAARIEEVAHRTGTTRIELINRWLTEKLDEAA